MADFMNRQKYGAVITENLEATQYGKHLLSLQDDTQDVENGWFGHIGSKISREVSGFITPDSTTITQNKAVLVAAPCEIFAGFTPEGFADWYFINIKGKPFRCYELAVNDEFSITEYTIDSIIPYDADAGTGGVTIGNFITLQAGSNRAKEISSLTGTEVFVGEIVDVDSSPLRPYIMINGKTPPSFVGIRVQKNSL